jgi:hypothetical protein
MSSMPNSAPATRAAFATPRTIPIVALDFTNDPVAEGYAKTYGQRGGNLTGVFLDAPSLAMNEFSSSASGTAEEGICEMELLLRSSRLAC